MDEQLVPIGRFSEATRLSVKALRHYDDIGLLRPAVTDPQSGYRYYRLGQANRAEAIRQLREKAVGVGGGNLPEKTRKLLEGAVLGYLRKNRGLLPRFSLAEREAAA